MASVDWHGDELLERLDAAVEVRLDVCAEHIKNTITQSMRDTPTAGEVIRIIRRNDNPTGRNYHQRYSRSTAGNPPAIQTGHLMRSIKWRKSGHWRRKIGTNLEYGLYLERGTRNLDGTPKMLARPWLRPAMENSRDFVNKQFNHIL